MVINRAKLIVCILCISLFLASNSWGILFTFSGTDAGGTGSAKMDISIVSNTLSLTLDNTSPLTLDGSSSDVNAPGIVAFGFFLGNAPLLTSWTLKADNADGNHVTIGSNAGGYLWDMKFTGDNNEGISLDYLPYLQDVKGALYNPSQDEGFGAVPNYFTTAYLEMVFNAAPVLETEPQSMGSGLSGITFVRMQNVGGDINADGIFGDGSLKLPGTPDNGGGPGVGTPVPEPSTIFLLGAGLVGLGIYGRRKFRK